ncbi:putative component of NuA3 histone acetyltransferase complex [Recurvomyces mirabilis]|uniref:uS12 prolyl 3,4-dihydroxylase n=1 Tax=Recurvomyces mirabilis TaxID=574656 RepID=A0AAE1C417_9PEZI|nr:putative component of NuA3 histone acetyltransferase complex [Recurvomyces mirabilis]KAK5156918.1 putative component of NuA3 histone acetyltransferase complex [Recurvomyces mirabilis]
MKRKADTDAISEESNGYSRKKVATEDEIQSHFGPNVFGSADKYAADYAASTPYKHAVVHNLISDPLLRSVRSEIVENIHFTPKETDIYKIHQSGDLANLDGLHPDALKKLPSLLQLRDALYSPPFRRWIQKVSGAGPLSGGKTDMAVNVYVPGCHLLCHDDVIGSRRVSYILYLTDPEKAWRAEWGGALRLYPTDQVEGEDGKKYKLPRAEWEKVIPPAWNQLSFFAVQPGESFHDVEEVYHRGVGDVEGDGGRVRMAISGWFHIPQEGEEGFEAGLEEKLAGMSSLQQLQGKAEGFDEPRTEWFEPESMSGQANGEEAAEEDDEEEEEEDEGLSEADLEFLLRFLTPNYLTPDTVEELNELFTDESTLQLTNILNKKFSSALREELESLDATTLDLPPMRTSRPPHKHRYQYALAQPGQDSLSPREQLLNLLLPSLSFRKWMSCITGLELKRCSVLARRFRRGLDYQLAQGYEAEEAQVEFTLCGTPSKGWGGGNDGDEVEEGDGDGKADDVEEEDGVGGYELYMAGDDADDDDDDEDGSDDGVAIPANAAHGSSAKAGAGASHTGAGSRRSAKQKKDTSDPAVYKAAAEGEAEDDGILFSNPASWNTLSIVLRDRGTLRFVKFVSRKARGDRWDWSGGFEVGGEDEDGEDDV